MDTDVKSVNVMIDLETLGQGHRPFLLCMAAVVFPLNGNGPDRTAITDKHTMFVRFSPKDQDKANRKIEPATLNWWLKQTTIDNKPMLAEMLAASYWSGVSLTAFYEQLKGFLLWHVAINNRHLLDSFMMDVTDDAWYRHVVRNNWSLTAITKQPEVLYEVAYKSLRMWARGLDFDMRLMNEIALDVGEEKAFWNYSLVRDVRTYLRAADVVATKDHEGKHDPFQDCVKQIMDVQTANMRLHAIPRK